MFGLNGRQLTMLLIVVVLFFVGAQYFPPYFAAFQFNDYVRQEVKYAASAKKTADTLRNEITKKAQELGIPLNKKDIRISRKGPSFTLELEYRWPINLRVYQHELVFQRSYSGELFENASD
jgi:hypothetical protein